MSVSAARVDSPSSPPQRALQVSLTVSLGLLAVSLATSVVLALLDAPVTTAGSLPWLTALHLAIAGLRISAARQPHNEQAALLCFWGGLGLAIPAVWLSPAIGLFLFIGYYEAAQFEQRALRIAGVVATALVISVAQVGGPTSVLFHPAIVAGFVALNLGISGLMMSLDRQRDNLMRELEATNAALRAEKARSGTLVEQLVARAKEAGVIEERQRVSREIHDTVAQDLVAIIAQLDAATAAPEAAERTRRIALAGQAAREALGEARRAVHALASPRLDDSDLPLALDDLLGEWRDTTGLGGELTVRGQAVASTLDDALLRVVQEALANVAKHAHARRADILLDYDATTAAVTVTVRDDGIGFNVADLDQPGGGARRGTGFGITGMAARMRSSGGSFEITSSEAGTVLRAGGIVTAPTEPRTEGAA